MRQTFPNVRSDACSDVERRLEKVKYVRKVSRWRNGIKKVRLALRW